MTEANEPTLAFDAELDAVGLACPRCRCSRPSWRLNGLPSGAVLKVIAE
ncbi:Response regulator SirA OS=Stutzerimonas stutzeri OX=316 GN=CXK95_11835 PE=3 SV=1 [Stutzerimonas stutzeri]